GNWMVVYEEYLGFTNSGRNTREFKLYMTVKGLLAINLKDENGKLIDSFYHNDSSVPIFDLTVEGGQTRGVYIEYVLLADCYGSIEHYVTADVTAVAPDFVPGDVDGNGTIEAADYLMCKRACLRSYELDEDEFIRADINANREIEAIEYLMIKRHVLKTYTIPGAEGK
ncbi:MAG: dockerin type I repeat-containing protein, partial [Clostridia bacterium]|nr:dockerin type I repeat-containing protein [Clostridia bacterium]